MDRRILVVDDSELVCQQLSQLLALPDRQITVAPDGTTALEWLVENRCSLVLTDLRLPGINGLDLIREIRERELPVTVIVMTGYATVESAVEAMKLGAYDLILKPIDTIRLEVLVNQALEDRRLIDEVADLRGRLRKKYAYHNLLGREPADDARSSTGWRGWRRRRATCWSPARRAPARSWSPRRSTSATSPGAGPLVAVNCAALPEHLLESELFGHERGAFTGADRQKKGRFELAHGGHALPRRDRRACRWACRPSCSACSRTARFERVGGTEPIQADCRVIAATNVNLAEAVAAGRFREDLFYRLNVVSIELPPLRERLEDIPLLVNHFLEKLAERGLPDQDGLAAGALAAALRYDWPGNVRELEHVIEQAMVTTPGPVIEPENLPPADRRPPRRAVHARLRPPPPAAGDHRRVHPADRVRLPPARPGDVPRPDRAVRQALRALAAEHQREAPPLPDRQARLQAPHVPAQAIRPGGRVRSAGAIAPVRTTVDIAGRGSLVGSGAGTIGSTRPRRGSRARHLGRRRCLRPGPVGVDSGIRPLG